MNIGSITKLIKNMIWCLVGVILLPIGIATLWLLIITVISLNVVNSSMFGYITIYLIIFFGMMMTTSLSLWVWKGIKNVFELIGIKKVIEKYLKVQLEKFEKQEHLKNKHKIN